jgi:phenylacetate-CoA ligase
MSSKLEKIYAVMPVSVQNLMVSVKGWTLKRKRYAKEYHQYLDSLMRSQWFSAEQFRELQTAELRKLLWEAIQNVPYYRETLSKFSSKIDAITIESMNELPLLEKSLLRENTEPFINKERLKYGYTEGHTSGTCGFPMVWPFDWDSMRYLVALRERQYRWAGTTTKAKSARFSGKLLLGKHDHAPYYRYNISEKQWLFSTYHLSSKTAPVYYEALRRINVTFIDGYPSALFTLAKWINENGKSGFWRPWMVNTTAETLMDFQREEIEKAFGCKVFNHYSSSEGAPFVTECMAGNMHMNPESGIIEFLRADGNPAEPDEEDAEMVITSFFQRTMPLIRYRIGDIGTFAEDQTCPCGRQMPIVKYITGRESNTLYTTERGSIGSAGLSTVFYKIPSRLKESQIEQVGKDSFLFRYVPLNGSLTKNEESVVIEQFKKRLGSSVTIDLQVVEQIPKGPSGKSRLVIGLKKDK